MNALTRYTKPYRFISRQVRFNHLIQLRPFRVILTHEDQQRVTQRIAIFIEPS